MTQPSLAFDLTPPPTTRRESPVAVERKRLNAAAARVLAFLQERGPHGATNVELAQPNVGGNRAIGRCFELRRDGWLIDKTHIAGGVWRYRLRGRTR